MKPLFAEEYGVDKLHQIEKKYEVIILAVSHKQFKRLNPKDHLIENGVVFDIKGFYDDPDYLYL